MRYVLSNRDEVMHYWANQRQDEGRSGNVSFRGPKLYSYARNIATIHEDESGRRLVLFDTSGYNSITTSGHISRAHSAASHMRQISVPRNEPRDQDDHLLNLRDILERISSANAKAKRARVHKDWHLSCAADLIEDYNVYAMFFSLPNRFSAEEAGVVEQALHEARLKRLEEQRKWEEERRKELAENVVKWRAGEDKDIYGNPDTLIRLAKDGKRIETSRNAQITVRTAKRLWFFIKQAHDTDTAITIDMDVDGYRLRGIDREGNLTVGCHFIKYDELLRMAHLLKLEEEVSA